VSTAMPGSFAVFVRMAHALAAAGALLSRAAGFVLALPVRAYRVLVSPLLPPACRFEPSCACYAIGALETHGALRGGWLAARRLARCQPFGSGGFDPVPPAARSADSGAPGASSDLRDGRAAVTPDPGRNSHWLFARCARPHGPGSPCFSLRLAARWGGEGCRAWIRPGAPDSAGASPPLHRAATAVRRAEAAAARVDMGPGGEGARPVRAASPLWRVLQPAVSHAVQCPGTSLPGSDSPAAGDFPQPAADMESERA